MKPFWRREPTKTDEKATEHNMIKMITMTGDYYYAWDGKLYESDIVRACIRPKVKAIGKLVGKHIRDDPKGGIKVNPEANIRFLLSEPNPYMTAQQMQEKVATQLCLNNNAFILIVRDENEKPVQLYPVPCVSAEAKYDSSGELFLKFLYRNGKSGTFRYADIIHLRHDYNEDDIFGDSPAPALTQMMNVIGTIDKGIIRAIKNSGIIRWLLTYSSSMREEDIKRNVEKFVENYLAVETDTFGAAGVDAKAKVERIEPKDYVPNAAQTDRTIERIYSFFNTNKKIVQSDYNEDEWNAYYEGKIEPFALQLSLVMSNMTFTPREIAHGNAIVFTANRLQYASNQTKLNISTQLFDRGLLNRNGVMDIWNMAHVEGGEKYYIRKDYTEVSQLGKEANTNAGNEGSGISVDGASVDGGGEEGDEEV